MGPWEGLSETDIEKRYPDEWNIWNRRLAELKLAGRETLDDLLERVLTGVRNISRDMAECNVIIRMLL